MIFNERQYITTKAKINDFAKAIARLELDSLLMACIFTYLSIDTIYKQVARQSGLFPTLVYL